MTGWVRPVLGALLLVAGVALLVHQARTGFRPAKAEP